MQSEVTKFAVKGIFVFRSVNKPAALKTKQPYYNGLVVDWDIKSNIKCEFCKIRVMILFKRQYFLCYHNLRNSPLL